MPKVTKRERRAIYGQAWMLLYFMLMDESYDVYADEDTRGVCNILKLIQPNKEISSENFPEFFLYKPKDFSTFWWPLTRAGLISRMKALENCINQTAHENA